MFHTLKDAAGSALDFVKLNNKDQLLSEGKFCAQKNDSWAAFFEYREIIHEELQEVVKRLIKDVDGFAVTLDKAGDKVLECCDSISLG